MRESDFNLKPQNCRSRLIINIISFLSHANCPQSHCCTLSSIAWDTINIIIPQPFLVQHCCILYTSMLLFLYFYLYYDWTMALFYALYAPTSISANTATLSVRHKCCVSKPSAPVPQSTIAGLQTLLPHTQSPLLYT